MFKTNYWSLVEGPNILKIYLLHCCYCVCVFTCHHFVADTHTDTHTVAAVSLSQPLILLLTLISYMWREIRPLCQGIAGKC